MSVSAIPGSVERRFHELFPGESIVLVDRVDAMASRFDSLPDQRPATCGAYGLSYLLEPLGFAQHDGNDLVAEDYLAHLAGVIIEEFEVEPSEAVARQVAAGQLTEAEAAARFPGTWYRYPVRHSPDPVVVGTSTAGIARAINISTDGRLVSLPISSRTPDGSVQLTEERWTALLGQLAARTTAWRWHAILNFQLVELLDPVSPAFTVENLRLDDPASAIPLDGWDVGHFVGVAGMWQRRGAWWLLLFDTYKERGFDGYQPQPASLMRNGLVRRDGRGGGVQLILPREALAEASEALGQLGLTFAMWDNGSTPPEDWTWELGR